MPAKPASQRLAKNQRMQRFVFGVPRCSTNLWREFLQFFDAVHACERHVQTKTFEAERGANGDRAIQSLTKIYTRLSGRV